jgi:hypothetical protein
VIGRFCDFHSGLGVPDCFVEPAELGKYVGESASRERRLNGGCTEAFVAQVALERDVPFEEGDRISELAPVGVRHPQK